MQNKIVILAGGKGTRMNCEIPKVLTKIHGQTIIGRQLANLSGICADPLIIIGYKGEEIIKATENKYQYIWQKEQLGTGHALMCAQAAIKKANIRNIVVIPGDHPLVSHKTIEELIKIHKQNKSKISMATMRVSHFDGDNSGFYSYGRVIRNKKGEVCRIVEKKDADDSQKEIKELNLSYYCFDTEWLFKNISAVQNNNNAQEYYLTDMVKIAAAQNLQISTVVILDILEGMGVNTPEQLRLLERNIQ